MRIAFATTQGSTGSSNIGRVMPLAAEFTATRAECFVLLLRPVGAPSELRDEPQSPISLQYVGTEPFRRGAAGKTRLRGGALIFNMVATALRTAWVLWQIKPDVVIISKPLPANVLGVSIYSFFSTSKIVLDVDDFELAANKLSSLLQRAVVHWSERRAAKLAHTVIAASPFLADHFKQLTQNAKPVKVIPTGINMEAGPVAQGAHGTILAYLGSVSVSSGHRVDMLPDILEQLKPHQPAQLVIAGDGDDVAHLKEEFERRGLTDRVRWFGRFAREDLPALLTSDTIIIDPVDDSIANRAKSSFRVMLAASLGLPVVTSNIGIRPRLLPQQFHERLFAEPGDAKSYAKICRKLAQQPLGEVDRRALREHAKKFMWDQLGSRYYEALAL